MICFGLASGAFVSECELVLVFDIYFMMHGFLDAVQSILDHLRVFFSVQTKEWMVAADEEDRMVVSPLPLCVSCVYLLCVLLTFYNGVQK